MPLQFFRLVSAEIVRGCGGSQKLRFRAWADAIRGVMRFSANKTKNLSVMQTGLDWSGVVMTQDSHQIPAVCSSILLKSPALFFVKEMQSFVWELSSILLFFRFVGETWRRCPAVTAPTWSALERSPKRNLFWNLMWVTVATTNPLDEF